MPNDLSSPTSRRAAIDAFLKEHSTLASVMPGTRGRLIFALDATASRQETWDTACRLQGDMFQAAIGALDIQLVFYRGLRECVSSRWISDGPTLAGLMEKIECRTGHTQIGRVLSHARQENNRQSVQALVFVGDCVEEDPADLYAVARELGLPAFLFQEGDDPVAAQIFRELARLTKGAYCRFDPGAARELGELLRAVAAYAAGGLKALSDLSGNTSAIKLLQQIR